MDETERLALLTEAEKEVLRLFLVRSDVKEMARTIGISAAAVEQRLHLARGANWWSRARSMRRISSPGPRGTR